LSSFLANIYVLFFTLIIFSIYGMLINLKFNKIKTQRNKWIFIIFSIIFYLGINFIIGFIGLSQMA